ISYLVDELFCHVVSLSNENDTQFVMIMFVKCTLNETCFPCFVDNIQFEKWPAILQRFIKFVDLCHRFAVYFFNRFSSDDAEPVSGSTGDDCQHSQAVRRFVEIPA